MSKKLKKRIKKSNRKRPFNPSATDRHHILWQAAHYEHGYAKRLRLHPWLILLIPRDTLHHEIHNKISDIPNPGDELCKKAYIKLTGLESQGLLDERATLEDRIDWLLDVWSFDECPRTVIALQVQKQVVHDFYRKAVD